MVENEQYLLFVLRYIHQNSLKAGAIKRFDEWKWSSCQIYYGKTSNTAILLDSELIRRIISEDRKTAVRRFKECNESGGNRWLY